MNSSFPQNALFHHDTILPASQSVWYHLGNEARPECGYVAMPCDFMLCYVMLCMLHYVCYVMYVTLCMLNYVILHYVIFCCRMLCYVMLRMLPCVSCCVVLCYVMLYVLAAAPQSRPWKLLCGQNETRKSTVYILSWISCIYSFWLMASS